MKMNISLQTVKKNMNCNNFFCFFGKKEVKMNNQFFIPSRGIRELYLDIDDMHWYMRNSSLFNFQKEIPFFKLIFDMASLHMRYYLQRNGNHLFIPQTLLDIGRISTYLIKSFITIKSFTEDLFCTGDIETVDYCIEVYRQFVNHELLNFFIRDKWEITLAFRKMQDELLNFSSLLHRFFILIYSLFPKKSKFRDDLSKTKRLFKKDLTKQLKMIIRKDGKYSSQVLKQGIFLKKKQI